MISFLKNIEPAYLFLPGIYGKVGGPTRGPGLISIHTDVESCRTVEDEWWWRSEHVADP